MIGFGRRKKQVDGTADTFLEATNGGWRQPAARMAVDGGSQADYVEEVLKNAREFAIATGVEVGDDFEYTLTNIPRGISSPHEIIFGLMSRGPEHGLTANYAHDETIALTRLS